MSEIDLDYLYGYNSNISAKKDFKLNDSDYVNKFVTSISFYKKFSFSLYQTSVHNNNVLVSQVFDYGFPFFNDSCLREWFEKKSISFIPSLINGVYVINKHLDYFPEVIKDFSNLRVLNLSGNCLSEFPDFIPENKLCKINLSNNEFSEFPENLSDLPLESLILRNNSLSSIPECISKFSKLKHLDLRGNSLERVDYGINNLSSLKFLDLSHNLLSDFPLFDSLNIKDLFLDHNKFSYVNKSFCESYYGKNVNVNLSDNDFFSVSNFSVLNSEFVYDNRYSCLKKMSYVKHLFPDSIPVIDSVGLNLLNKLMSKSYQVSDLINGSAINLILKELVSNPDNNDLLKLFNVLTDFNGLGYFENALRNHVFDLGDDALSVRNKLTLSLSLNEFSILL